MADDASTDNVWRPSSFLRRLLFAFTALMGIEIGAGLFVTAVIFPLWTASPQAAIGWTSNTPYYVEEGVFFIIVSPLLFLLALVTLVTGWRARPPLRRWLRIATITYLVAFIVTIAYFVPLQDRVKGPAGAQIRRAELSSMLTRFVTFNYLRQAAGLLAFAAAIHALGISYGMARRKESEPFPAETT